MHDILQSAQQNCLIS